MAVALRILFFLLVAGVLMWAAWSGTGARRAANERRINAERRAQEPEAATQAFVEEKPVPYPGLPTTQPATQESATTQPGE